VNSGGWGSIERNFNALVGCCFNLGKNRFLFCKWVTSLEGCDVINSSYEYFFLCLLNSSMECWAEVFWTNMVRMLWI